MVVGALPMKSEGLKCYSCEGPACDKPNENAAKVCGENEGACFMSGLRSMKRGCYSKAKADCIQETIGGNCFSPDGHKELAKNLGKCIEETKKEEETGGLPEAGQGTICVCTEDLCNESGLQVAGSRARNIREVGSSTDTGLKCRCQDQNGSPCPNCDAYDGYCMIQTIRERIVGQGCVSSTDGNCLKEELHNGLSCFSLAAGKGADATNLAIKARKCGFTTETRSVPNSRKLETKVPVVTLCLCDDKDECNTKELEQDFLEKNPLPSLVKDQVEQSSSPHREIPSRKLLTTIFAILTTLISNLLKL